MQYPKSYIKAFTLTEIMVVLVLSAIVVGIAFSVLTLVQRNMNSITTNYEYQSQIKALEVGLTMDIHRCTQMQWEPETAILSLSSPIHSVEYKWYGDSIVTPTTTHRLTTKQMTFYRLGNIVTSGTVDAVELDFEHTSPLHRTFIVQHTDLSPYFEPNSKHRP